MSKRGDNVDVYHVMEETMQETTMLETTMLSDSSQEKDGFRWPHGAIILLLTVYKEQEHRIISGKTSMKKFWLMVASKLVEKGYDVTGSQCKSKMAGLRNTYKNIKVHNSKGRNNNTRTWQYYDIMDELFKDAIDGSTECTGLQLANARESFRDIANKHAESMSMLVGAMKLQAEVNLQLSVAIEKIAKNEERQTVLLELIYKLLNK